MEILDFICPVNCLIYVVTRGSDQRRDEVLVVLSHHADGLGLFEDSPDVPVVTVYNYLAPS